MDYDCTIGNMLTEEVCKSDNPGTGCTSPNADQNSKIYYHYDPTYKVLDQITDPRSCPTGLTYDSTKTFVYNTTNCLGHTTTTEYHPSTGNLKKLIPPHFQGTSYFHETQYDVFGRKIKERLNDNPSGEPIVDRGWTAYTYPSLTDPNNLWGDPYTQHVQKQQHIVGGPAVLEHYASAYFDGMGRTYWTSSSGPNGKSIITETEFDNVGRVWKKYNPRFNTDSPPYAYTEFTYDGFSRVIETAIPDDVDPSGFTYVTTTYQGLKKVVTNQRGYSTAYTYDAYQRLTKVEQALGTPEQGATEYRYDTLGNLTQVIAPKLTPEHQNITTMIYDSLSKKKTMTDPDMGSWTYEYDKNGNLELQIDAKGQKIRFLYDSLNRVYEKRYGDPTPISTVFYTYDDPTVPNSKGKLTKVSYQPSGEELREDRVLEYDLLQMVKSSKKKTGADEVTYERLYNSLGRVITLTTFGIPSQKTFSYEYDVAGNLLYVGEGGTHYVDYSGFTPLGQPTNAAFSNTVTTAYGYYPKTGRINTLATNKSGTPYQNLTYQYDPKGNISTLIDSVNNITHTYGYDSLNRLDWAKGNNGNAYDHNYDYDRIGNILFKTDVGTYSYGNYSVRPHAAQSAGPFTFTYDANGNMISKTGGGVNIAINPQDWNYDNKPTRIQNGSNTINLVYDGNGQRVKKTSSNPTVFYFGEAYEKRGAVEVFHVFAGSRRVVSLRSDGKNQFYHPNHLGSASVITDQLGDWKEKIEYYPFGSYREDIKNPLDPTFPDANYTYTDQEDDDELGLYNYRARLYDPVLGKFISPDNLVPYPTNPQTLNRYAYCLNNPLIYTDPSGEIFGIDDLLASMIIGAVIGAAMGAINAAINHQNILQGALIGAASGAISAAVGYGVGGAVTDFLTPQGALEPTSIAKIIGAMAGGFSGGAVGGAYTAMAYGGNVWQGALYGALIGAAIAGSVAGVMEFTGWINSESQIKFRNAVTGKMQSTTPGRLAEFFAENLLDIRDEKFQAEDFYNFKKYTLPISRDDQGGLIARQINDYCATAGGCHRAIDFKTTAWKFDSSTLHIRSLGDKILFHWDQFNLSASFGGFVNHIAVDVFRNVYYAVKDLGLIEGIKVGL